MEEGQRSRRRRHFLTRERSDSMSSSSIYFTASNGMSSQNEGGYAALPRPLPCFKLKSLNPDRASGIHQARSLVIVCVLRLYRYTTAYSTAESDYTDRETDRDEDRDEDDEGDTASSRLSLVTKRTVCCGKSYHNRHVRVSLMC